ncbi:phage baseplate assembly protein V [Streptomyces sp. 061-3]|uniref:phage baseplate assembly protein V n=1 Tax=Streptomyces sp. 061-3 TaxID=2789268 RepID=UPI00397FD76E
MTPLYGTFSAIVVDAHDPQNRGRARLRIPQVMGTAVSGWAEPVVVGAVLPGDQVYVSFDGGDRNFPVFWPRLRSAVPGLWAPLALESGWVASTGGSPVYRVTPDGMVELSGSVENPNAIGTGVSVKFASLPLGTWPVERHRAATATAYRTAYTSKTVLGEYRATTSTTSISYVTDANGPSVSFVAPASGQAIVVFGAFMQANLDVGRCLMGVRVLQGATIITDGDDNRSAEVQGPDNVSASNSLQVSSMTPGTTYTVTAVYRSDTASSTASFDNKWIVVIPVGQHDTPAARISMETNGDLFALFPGGAAAPYDMSLTGIRARIV